MIIFGVCLCLVQAVNAKLRVRKLLKFANSASTMQIDVQPDNDFCRGILRASQEFVSDGRVGAQKYMTVLKISMVWA